MSKRLDDGYQTLISFANAPSVKFYEKTVTPPGMDAGGEVDVTTMRNTLYRTRNPKHLITMSNMSSTVAWDPAAYNDVLSMIHVNQLITVTLPDGSTVAFWGWLDKFTPGEHQEGTQPTATVEIVPSNQNDSQVETAPVITLS